MAKNIVVFKNIRENSKVIIGDKTVCFDETIELDNPDEIKIAKSCEYLMEV